VQASWRWASVGIVSVIVSLFGAILTTQLSHEQLIDWGWRIPYVFGLLIGPAGVYIRAHIDETPDFLKAERSQKVSISDLLRRHPVPLLLAFGATIVSASSYYLLLYILTYGIKALHLPAYAGFLATLVGGIILATFSVVAGHRSDETVPRTRIMLITAWLFLLATYPCFWLMDVYPSVATAVFAVSFLNLIKGGYSGVLPYVLRELFPVGRRRVRLQHVGDEFRRFRPVCCDLADRADWRSSPALTAARRRPRGPADSRSTRARRCPNISPRSRRSGARSRRRIFDKQK
jgi:MFS transporter, MHS family, proline/betaine transporter